MDTRRNSRSSPEEAREFPILDDVYDDEDVSYMPLLDEGRDNDEE